MALVIVGPLDDWTMTLDPRAGGWSAACRREDWGEAGGLGVGGIGEG